MTAWLDIYCKVSIARIFEVRVPPRPHGFAASIKLLYVVSGKLWSVGAIFSGLWLVPMGWLVLHSAWMPRALGYVLVVGGVGYVLSAFVGQTVPEIGAVADALTIPASAGEFWMIGYLVGASAGDGNLREVFPRRLHS